MKVNHIKVKKTIHEIDYNLCLCQECLMKRKPEYKNIKNKGRVFNIMQDITKIAFNINEEEFEKWKKENYSLTKENFIKNHGEEEGLIKWKEYCYKQAETNTFEYKRQKLGWNKEMFDDFNKSRATTIKNLVRRQGEEEGMKIF